MTEYTIYTEDVNGEATIKLIERHLTSATIYRGHGIYKKSHKSALVIKCLGTANEKDRKSVYRLAKTIQKQNDQNCVLVTEHQIAMVALERHTEAYEIHAA